MIKITIAGDLVHNESLERLDKINYPCSFSEIADIIRQSNFSIVNLEAPVIIGTPSPISKLGPNLHCSPKVFPLLNYLGFNCVTLANNHFYDQGENGVRATIEECISHGIATVGGGYNLKDASETLYVELASTKVAIINCCEKEYSIASHNSGGSNPMEVIGQYYAIQNAKKNSDILIVITHGGIEHFQYPTITMQNKYRFFIDAGADVVINHHQHRFSGFELYKDAPIFYGLGNFCFPRANYTDSFWNYGYLVTLKIDDKIDFEITPYKQCNGFIGVKLLTTTEKETFDEDIEKINHVIEHPQLLSAEYEKLARSSDARYDWLFQPVTNRLYKAISCLLHLPNPTSMKKIDEILSLINCESHRDRFVYYLKNHTTKHHI